MSAALDIYTLCLLSSFKKIAKPRESISSIYQSSQDGWSWIIISYFVPNFARKAVEMQRLGGVLLVFCSVLGSEASNIAARRLQHTFPVCGKPRN